MLTSQAFRDYFSSSLSLSSQGCRSPCKRLFLESEGNAYIPSIQRHFPLLALSHLKAAGALLKDSPCSFSLGGYATAQNRPELLAQPPTVGSSLKRYRVAPSSLDTQTAPCDTWHRSFHPDGNPSFHPDISYPEFCPTNVLPLSGCLTATILSGRHPTFSRYLTSGACQADVPTSPDRNVRIFR